MRSIASRSCASCGGGLEEGFLLDRRQALEAAGQEWIAGEPVRNWLGLLRLRGRRRGTIVAARCRKCGRVELWAPETAG